MWRTQEQFKKLVQELRNEYADYIAGNILGDIVTLYSVQGVLDKLGPNSGLLLQKQFITESLHYPPDLISEIAGAMAKLLDSDKTELETRGYLGYYMYCLNLIGAVLAHSGKKSRWRAVYLDIGKKVLGYHWKNAHFLNYFAKYCPPRFPVDPKVYGETSLTVFQDDFAEGRFLNIQHKFNYEFRAIIKAEIFKLERDNNELSSVDITTAVDFLGEG